ncbi:hypothetical protein RM574_25670 [Streptomyces sp. DSM 41982]|uniref:Uncharacterized protein n=1 Tax=Streptomyces evansiae TaxID=3075535 RepID=A0ABD5EBU0_9ACTN|nr:MULTISPECIES: hypothetical protein [unclassified Streptomyces]MDT0418874.1 hypothetical protein [Streptomyces sp. DSM 41982]SCD74462.1 hypothetical protein GA0115246_105455 [Streptomyces sp. SolWspMP-sol7th]
MSLTRNILRVVPASAVLTVAAASPAAAKGDVKVDSSGLQEWITKNAIPLTILVVVLAIILVARKKDTAGALTMGFIVLIGIMVLGLSVGTTASDVGAFLVGLVVTK